MMLYRQLKRCITINMNRVTRQAEKAADLVFKALGDSDRRRILDRLRERGGLTLTELCNGIDMTRQGVTRHIDLLEEAGLVVTRREGREKLHYLNPVPIHEIAERWIKPFERSRLEALRDLKAQLEK
jgi:DNA-binding transcriptional ArsR family regulator